MIWETILSVIALLFVVGIGLLFIFRLGKYSFLGNTLLYVGIFYVISVFLSVHLNFNNLVQHGYEVVISTSQTNTIRETPVIPTNGFVTFFTSFFDALKMITVSFDRQPISDYLMSGEWNHVLFGVAYLASAISGAIYTSVAVIIAFFIGFGIKAKTLVRGLKPSRDMYYIFTDSKVSISVRLAEGLKKDGKNVVIFLSKASQKTQEGTEYKDMMVGKKLDVRIEKYGPGLMLYLFKKHFSKARLPGFRNKKVFVYGLFSDDDTSVEIANGFKQAIANNKTFAAAKRKLYFSVKYDKPIKIQKLIETYETGSKEEKLRVINELGQIYGIKEVVNYKNRYIKKYIKKYKISDDLTGYLISSLQKYKVLNRLDDNFVIYDEKRIEALLHGLENKKKEDPKESILNAIENYKVFVTYHESDLDYANNYSQTTLHIVNTMSEYDMISSEFVLNNQLNNFIDVNNFNYEDNKHMHVTFLGLGKINKPILEKMTFAYQLWGDNTNKINYHVLDAKGETLAQEFINDYSDKEKVANAAKESYLPLLYTIDSDLSGKDLTNYEIIDEYVKNLFKEDSDRFENDGFEIFVISLVKTTTDIQIALDLRKAIMKYKTDKKNAAKTIIFVRIGNTTVSQSFFSNNTFVKSQEWVNEGNLLKPRTDDETAPIVIYGENALMSEYVSSHYRIIDELGRAAQMSYYGSTEAVRKMWLLNSKREVLDNTCTVYSLKTKLALLGYNLDEKYCLVKDNVTGNYENEIKGIVGLRDEDLGKKNDNMFLPISKYSLNMKRLAELEHNRWVASCYLIWKYRQLAFENFLDTIRLEGGKIKSDTKNNNHTEHVCMITNEGLQILKEKMVKKGEEKKIEDQAMKFNAANLTVLNDVKGMRDVFMGLPEE